MPELPDIAVYLEALAPRIEGRVLQRIRIGGPSLLRTAEPPIHEAEGKNVAGLRRLGKRIVVALEDELRLLKRDWPRSLEELEARRRSQR